MTNGRDDDDVVIEVASKYHYYFLYSSQLSAIKVDSIMLFAAKSELLHHISPE